MNPRVSALLVLFAAMPAAGQSVSPSPAVGYVYPAGARRGTTTELLVGGRALRGVHEVRVSGTGVEARVIGSYRSLRQMGGDPRKVLAFLVASRRATLRGEKPPPLPEPLQPGVDGKPKPEAQPPDHPLVDLLPTLTLAEVRHWETFLKRDDRLLPARHLEETVRVEIKVAPEAPPGPRELRLIGANGLSIPLRFHIGTLPEMLELEPNETPQAAPLELPRTINGQIQSGDVDHFRFHARRGQQLVIDGAARSLIPYLADAVPGWFQMVLAVRDPQDREIACADHFHHHPDPLLAFKVPEDGIYTLEIRDSIYRGRDDFVYRIALGELPLVSSVFPLGGHQSTPLKVACRGWNLKTPALDLDTAPGGPARRPFTLPDTRSFHYAVDDLPEFHEGEPNDTHATAHALNIPLIANGRIASPGDVDIYRIEARTGKALAIEIIARRLGSPLDAVVHVADAEGRIVAWNDDQMAKSGHLHLDDGLLTHHADPRLTVDPLSDGPLWIRVADTRHAGGPDHGYRLQVTPLQPDFALRVSPSGLSTGAGRRTPLAVHVLRRHGFDGPIQLELADAPAGFRLSGGLIPHGADGCRLTLDAPPHAATGLFQPRLLGKATIAGETVTREAVPSDDRMQAFLWRHLVEAEEWLVQVRGKTAPITRVGSGPVKIPAGGSTVVRFKAWKDLASRISPEPSEAPPGLTVSRPKPTTDGFTIEIHAPAGLTPGERFNLIVDLYPAKDGRRVANARFPNNSLPALPVHVTPLRTP